MLLANSERDMSHKCKLPISGKILS